jgi:hypothetical protein
LTLVRARGEQTRDRELPLTGARRARVTQTGDAPTEGRIES